MAATKKWPEFLSSASDPEPDDSIEDFEAALDLDSLTLDDLEMPGHDGMDQPARAVKRARGKQRIRPMPILLALVVLVSLGTVVFYGYSWFMGGSADGELPLVQAIDDPIKVKPESPGGLEVPYQEQLVLNQEQPNGDGEPMVERLLPPPEEPTWPRDSTPAQDAATTAGTAESAPVTPVAPVSPATDEPATAEVAAAPEEPVMTQRTEAADEGQTAEPATRTATAEATQGTTQAASGDFRVQLASLTSYDATGSAWKDLQRSHPGLLGKLPLHVQKAQVSGKTYYRIQVGDFASRAEAGALCARLKAKQQDCLVVRR